MQLTLTVTALLSVASAAAVTKRYPATLSTRQSGVCGALSTPLCCQLDVLGVANLNCENGKSRRHLCACIGVYLIDRGLEANRMLSWTRHYD